jgi:hypothetical protein
MLDGSQKKSLDKLIDDSIKKSAGAGLNNFKIIASELGNIRTYKRLSDEIIHSTLTTADFNDIRDYKLKLTIIISKVAE